MTEVVTYYFVVQILLSLSFLTLWLAKKYLIEIKYQQLIRISYFFVLSAFLIPLFMNWSSVENPFGPVMKVWTHSESEVANVAPVVSLRVPHEVVGTPLKAEFPISMGMVVGFLLMLGIGYRAFQKRREFIQLNQLLDSSYLYKSNGNVLVWLNESVGSPFSFYNGQANIVLPYDVIHSHRKLKISLAHEIQHHRNGDTKWAYLFEFLQLFFSVNPLISKLNFLIMEIQELACDETLVGRKNFSAQAYGNCLYDFAEQQLSKPPLPIGAVGMAAEAKLLKRRIEMLFQERKTSLRAIIMVMALGLTTMTTAAWAFKGSVSGKEIGMKQAQAYADKMNRDSEVPIVIDTAVLHWLNKAVESDEHKHFMKKALERMHGYYPMISAKLSDGGLPVDLAAVPLPESSYLNTAKSNSSQAVGIWQFIPSTARKCGLRVDDQVDERMNPERHTDAAVCYYQKLFAIFNNWHAAIVAYNIGENRLMRVISKEGHNDILRLAREGLLGREGGNYLPKVIAAMIIIKNPELLD